MATRPAPLRLDPLGRDQHGENAALRALGPVARVELPGGVPAWAVTRHDLLQELPADPRTAKDPRHWRALAEGEVPEGWPLITFVTVPGMMTADGAAPPGRRTSSPTGARCTGSWPSSPPPAAPSPATT